MAPIYDRKQANRISFRVVIVLAIALAAYFAIELSTDPVTAGASALKVSALLGFSVPYSEIRDIELVNDRVPPMSRVVGNDAFGLFREGTYNVDGIGSARVFLKRPYLSYLIVKTDDKDYLVSLGSKEKDQQLYDRIKMGMK